MKQKKYSPEEINILKEYYGKIPVYEIQKKYLKNKTCSSIRSKAWDLNLKSSIPHSKETREKINKANTRELKSSAYKPTKELAYIIGVLNGDGSLGQRKLRLGITDKDFSEHYAKILENWSGIKPAKYKEKSKYYKEGFLRRIVFYSAKMELFLMDYYISKNKNALKNIKKLLNNNKEYQIKFIEGFFDSEGSIQTHRIKISNSNKELLDFISNLFTQLEIKTKIYSYITKDRKIKGDKIKGGKAFYQLSIQTKQDVAQFCKIINSSIERKQKKILENRKLNN